MKARDASLFSLPVLPATVAGAFNIARPAAEKAGDGFVKIENRAWGKCLNLQDHADENGGIPNVWECTNHPDQEWKVQSSLSFLDAWIYLLEISKYPNESND